MSNRIDQVFRRLAAGSTIDLKHFWYETSLMLDVSEKAFYRQIEDACERYGFTIDMEEKTAQKPLEDEK